MNTRLAAVAALIAILPFAAFWRATDSTDALGASAQESAAQESSQANSDLLRGLSGFDRKIAVNTIDMLQEGRAAFRFNTFGDEAFWGAGIRLHDAIKGAVRGGVGPGLSPAAALELGLKVDLEALPASLVGSLSRDEVDLDDPAVTLALLRLRAVVGVTGFFAGDNLVSVGIQCALCHSVVDDSLAPGIGRRLDGWANRDLDIGAIVALAPDLRPFVRLLRLADPSITQADVRDVLNSWGAGKFDAALTLDGKAFQPDGDSAATLIPPAFGLAGVTCIPGRAGVR
jgi:hypothetical protein